MQNGSLGKQDSSQHLQDKNRSVVRERHTVLDLKMRQGLLSGHLTKTLRSCVRNGSPGACSEQKVAEMTWKKPIKHAQLTAQERNSVLCVCIYTYMFLCAHMHPHTHTYRCVYT